jgi:hypothetical protein
MLRAGWVELPKGDRRATAHLAGRCFWRPPPGWEEPPPRPVLVRDSDDAPAAIEAPASPPAPRKRKRSAKPKAEPEPAPEASAKAPPAERIPADRGLSRMMRHASGPAQVVGTIQGRDL